MYSWDILPAVVLKESAQISEAFIDLGIKDFRSAAEWVNRLPYGRNVAPADALAVIRERRGTCSTKHTLLRRLALEQDLSVGLRLGIYAMTGRNTPGAGGVLAKYGLRSIPEAHCFLSYDGRRVDVTRATEGKPQRPSIRFVYEEDISPDQIGSYKNELHRRFLRRWLVRHRRSAAYALEEIWAIREECIAALAQPGPKVVRGVGLDFQTRCAHYHGPTDIIAIKMKCCGEYYACKDCHDAFAGHPIDVWREAEWDEKAVLCGACQSEMTIREYLESDHRCGVCQAQFNPKCKNHYHYYFAIERD